MYLRWKKIKAGRLNENLFAARQLQFKRTLFADFDFDQFLVFPAVVHHLKAHSLSPCERM
jgi:hypothetical protein